MSMAPLVLEGQAKNECVWVNSLLREGLPVGAGERELFVFDAKENSAVWLSDAQDSRESFAWMVLRVRGRCARVLSGWC